MAGRQRQRMLAREKLRRQQARRAEAAAVRRRRRAILGSAVAVLAVIAIGVFAAIQLSSDGSPSSSSTSRATPQAKASAAACTYPRSTAGPVPRTVKAPPTAGVPKTGILTVRLATNQGAVTLRLDRAKAPCTVNSFASLVQQKYFDKTSCHRLTTSGIYVLQCGDPAGTGSGGPGYSFADENLPAAKNGQVTYRAGTVAMANAGADTNGSQFFIVHRDTQFDPNYTIFGTVASGLEVVRTVAKAGANPSGDGKPKQPVTIATATIAAT